MLILIICSKSSESTVNDYMGLDYISKFKKLSEIKRR